MLCVNYKGQPAVEDPHSVASPTAVPFKILGTIAIHKSAIDFRYMILIIDINVQYRLFA